MEARIPQVGDPSLPLRHQGNAQEPRRDAATSKDIDLVMTALRMAIWQRDHDGAPQLASPPWLVQPLPSHPSDPSRSPPKVVFRR